MYRTIRLSKKALAASVGIVLFSLLLSRTAASVRPEKSYAHLYPDLYAAVTETTPVGEEQAENATHKAYLTFDDGPSGVTPQILDILDQLGIKATFFVIGRADENDVATLKRIHDEGHAIGIHSYSHVYQQIYAGVEDYLTDFSKIEEWIFAVTGEHTKIFRFPGGSNNSTAKKSVMTDIAAEMTRRGFIYYDWNVIAHDDQKTVYSADVLYQNVVKSAKGKLDRDLILLFHDNATRKTTPDVLPRVVEYFRCNGYEFDKITPDTKPIQFNKPK